MSVQYVIAVPFADVVVGPFPTYKAARQHAIDYGYDMTEAGQIVPLIKPEDDIKESELNNDRIPF